MNPKYKEKVKVKLDKPLEECYIFEVENNEWVSLIVVGPMKNGKLWAHIDYRALNKATNKDPFLIPFIEDVLGKVACHKVFSFTHRFNGYNQVRIAPKD